MKGIRIDVWCLLVLLSIFSRRTGVDSAPALLTPREQYPFVAGLDEQLISKVGGLDSLTCDACKFIVGKLQDLMAKGATEDIIAGAAKDLCRLFKIEDKTVCEEGVDVFKVSIHAVRGVTPLPPPPPPNTPTPTPTYDANSFPRFKLLSLYQYLHAPAAEV